MLHATKNGLNIERKAKFPRNHHDHAPYIPPTGQEIPVCEIRYRVHNNPPVKSILKQPSSIPGALCILLQKGHHKWECQGFFFNDSQAFYIRKDANEKLLA